MGVGAAEAFSKCITLLNIFICCAMMYPYYAQQDSAEPLLSIFMWAGYLVALYSIQKIGLTAILEATYRLAQECILNIIMPTRSACSARWRS